MIVKYLERLLKSARVQFPSELSLVIPEFKNASWARQLEVMDWDFNRHLRIVAELSDGTQTEKILVSIYDLKRFSAKEFVDRVRYSLGVT